MSLGVLILAAGQGKRMRSRLPKVLHPLAGQPLLAHVLAAATALEPARILVVIGHGAEQVRAAFPEAGCDWVIQAEQRGTGDAAIQALPQLAVLDRVLILFGDVPLIAARTLSGFLDLARDSALGLLTAEVPDPTGYGRILRAADGRILGVVEHRDATDAQRRIREINTGLMVAEVAALARWLADLGTANAQGECYLTDIVARAAHEGVCIAHHRPAALSEIAGVNDRVQLATLERLYQRQQAECLMRAGVSLADPARFDLRGRLHAEPDVWIDVDVVIEGEVRLGTGVRIGPHCRLRDCAIAADATIESHSVIDGAEVGAGARVGPFARLRPGTRLGEHTHVGNFVETKQVQLGRGSKVNHLTYLGDALVGERVNVGAGTITCNYDGAYKHQTRIGDDAFIGSNTALVAPVAVGEGATIGAGSVITRDAPSGQLSVARGRQVTLSGWRRPRKPGVSD